MIQYRIIQSLPDELEFIMPGKGFFRLRLAEYTIKLLLSIYGVLFLGVTVPFLHTHSLLIYLPGLFIVIRYLLILYNIVKHMYIYCDCRISFKQDVIISGGPRQKDCIHLRDIQYCTYSVTGLFCVHSGSGKLSFPTQLLQHDSLAHFLSYSGDLTPGRTQIWGKIREVAEAAILALILAVHIIWYIAQNYYIPTGSMRNTLVEGDHIFGEKLTLGLRLPKMLGLDHEIHCSQLAFRTPRRGDVVVFDPPVEHESREYIKRIIALEGDRFNIMDDKVYVNNQPLVEPYALGPTRYLGDDGIKIEGIVPRGCVIVLGDNRTDSQDSRIFGYVPVRNIRSRAVFLYFNSSQFKKLDFSRFGFIR